MATSPLHVVWFAEIKWDYLRTRKQQIIRRKPDDIRLLYLEPYLRGSDNRFELRMVDEVPAMWCATVPFVKAIPSGPLRRVAAVGAARSVVDAVALSRVRKHARAAGFDDGAAAIISNVYAIDVADRFGGRFIAYDCNDAHGEFPGMPAWTRGYFERSCRRADTVLATSSVLMETIGALRDDGDVTFLGNGVDVEHFARERERLGAPPRHAPPCIGYLGAIAPWFDFDAVERLADERPGWNIHLVGPVLPGAEAHVARLSARANVSIAPAVPYDRVPEVMRGFTVGLIPFRYDDLTRAVNPNKMYEYLAMGVPVVATRFSREVRRYPGLVTAAADAAELVVACDEFVSLADDPARAAAFREEAYRVAGENDWSVIAEMFWGHIRGCFDRFA